MIFPAIIFMGLGWTLATANQPGWVGITSFVLFGLGLEQGLRAYSLKRSSQSDSEGRKDTK